MNHHDFENTVLTIKKVQKNYFTMELKNIWASGISWKLKWKNYEKI
jgi:hypothetical protein